MSEYLGRVYPSEVAARRAIARGDWLITVERAAHRLPNAVVTYCLDPANQARWWPNPHRDQKEQAA